MIYGLGRKSEVIEKNGLTKSFVAVWNTNKKPENSDVIIQNNLVLDLWNKGKIENVYFDIQGTQEANNKTDFVFYINTETKEDAIALCESLPFFKKNIATYEIHEVGVFWLGNYKNN